MKTNERSEFVDIQSIKYVHLTGEVQVYLTNSQIFKFKRENSLGLFNFLNQVASRRIKSSNGHLSKEEARSMISNYPEEKIIRERTETRSTDLEKLVKNMSSVDINELIERLKNRG